MPLVSSSSSLSSSSSSFLHGCSVLASTTTTTTAAAAMILIIVFWMTPLPVAVSAFVPLPAFTTTNNLHDMTRKNDVVLQAAADRRRTWKQRPSPVAITKEKGKIQPEEASSSSTFLVLEKSDGDANVDNVMMDMTTVSATASSLGRSMTTTKSTKTTSSNNKNKLRPREKSKPMPITGYNAAAIEHFYDQRPLQVGWRLNSLGFPLLGWYLNLLMDQFLQRSNDLQVQRQRGVQLRQLLIQSKSVALIKSGQALSLRPDLLRNPIWAQELGKLVDAVGSFDDVQAMQIMKQELQDVQLRLKVSKNRSWSTSTSSSSSTTSTDASQRPRPRGQGRGQGRRQTAVAATPVQKLLQNAPSDSVWSLFEFYNNAQAVASASIGQVYKARIIRNGPKLQAAIGPEQAAAWGGKTVAVKIQRPDVEASASLDMYLLRRTALWLSKVRGGDLVQIADAFGMQLFGELDYIREADNCERFRELYGDWSDVRVPRACLAFTRRRVLVMDWIDGEKGPWSGQTGIDMVRIGLRCSVDQLMTTGLFHADPHRGNLIKTPDNKLAFVDFGMMADIAEEDRYGLFGLVIGLQNKDLPLVTENLLKLGFLKDTTQLDILIPRLRQVMINSTGGTGKASDVNFARLQAELDSISRENVVKFATPPFFTIIIRSLTILEGIALSVDPGFKLVRGSYPYVLRQLLSPEYGQPVALQKLLIRLLTVDGLQQEIEWERLRDFLRLAQKASKAYDPTVVETDDKSIVSRQTIAMFGQFLTSRTGIFLKKPLVHELAEAIDGSASSLEANLFRAVPLLPQLPGMVGPIKTKRMEEIQILLETFQEALLMQDGNNGGARMEAIVELFRSAMTLLSSSDPRMRQDAGPLLEELRSVILMVAVEVLEIRGSRAMRSLMGIPPEPAAVLEKAM